MEGELKDLRLGRKFETVVENGMVSLLRTQYDCHPCEVENHEFNSLNKTVL